MWIDLSQVIHRLAGGSVAGRSRNRPLGRCPYPSIAPIPLLEDPARGLTHQQIIVSTEVLCPRDNEAQTGAFFSLE